MFHARELRAVHDVLANLQGTFERRERSLRNTKATENFPDAGHEEVPRTGACLPTEPRALRGVRAQGCLSEDLLEVGVRKCFGQELVFIGKGVLEMLLHIPNGPLDFRHQCADLALDFRVCLDLAQHYLVGNFVHQRDQRLLWVGHRVDIQGEEVVLRTAHVRHEDAMGAPFVTNDAPHVVSRNDVHLRVTN